MSVSSLRFCSRLKKQSSINISSVSSLCLWLFFANLLRLKKQSSVNISSVWSLSLLSDRDSSPLKEAVLYQHFLCLSSLSLALLGDSTPFKEAVLEQHFVWLVSLSLLCDSSKFKEAVLDQHFVCFESLSLWLFLTNLLRLKRESSINISSISSLCLAGSSWRISSFKEAESWINISSG